MKSEKFLTTTELAKLLGISRIAVYKRIKGGKIKAARIGHDFIIDKEDLGGILKEKLTEEDKLEIERAVKRTAEEYGEALKLLGKT